MLKNRTLRIIVGIVLVVGVLSALLALDLSNRGLAWQTFWSLTGEEQPLAQVRGMVEWLGNFTRLQPNTAPLTPIDHVDVNPFGINTSLEQEVELAKRERQVQMIADAGFHWIRQEFPWEDIEVHGRGDFVDRRNDLDGDDVPDPVDAWAKYDHIIALAEQYGLEIQLRLSNPPDWTHANPDIGEKAPPDDVQDYVNFAVAVAERYRGRVRYFQVWNEPNIFPEWGNQDVNPEAYTDLLCQTYDALKAVDPEIVIISGALAGTVSLTGRDLNDFIFLQRMYDAGAGACFDILSAQGYGLNSGPTDHRMRPTTVTFARHIYIRDLMVANGDAHKPIWISEAAWNPVDEPSVPPTVEGRENYGAVTLEQAARYMPLAYQRAQEEWPWVGVINYWFFKRASDFEANQSFYYFRMVEPDFTPLPIHDAMREYIHNQQPVLYAGVHQAESWEVNRTSIGHIVPVERAGLGTVLEINEFSFTAQGTDVILRWKGDSFLLVQVNDTNTLFHPQYDPDSLEINPFTSAIRPLFFPEEIPYGDMTFEEGGWFEAVIAQSIFPETYTVRVVHAYSTPLQFDSITVLDRTVENVLPLAAGAAIVVGMTLWVVVSALRARGKTKDSTQRREEAKAQRKRIKYFASLPLCVLCVKFLT